MTARVQMMNIMCQKATIRRMTLVHFDTMYLNRAALEVSCQKTVTKSQNQND